MARHKGEVHGSGAQGMNVRGWVLASIMRHEKLGPAQVPSGSFLDEHVCDSACRRECSPELILVWIPS
jgi:hypothetical protein